MTLPNTEPEFPEWYGSIRGGHAKFFTDEGYQLPCKMHGKTVAVMQFIFTVGIVVGMDDTGYECRYCYGSLAEAYIAYATWLKTGTDEPANYIKRKP